MRGGERSAAADSVQHVGDAPQLCRGALTDPAFAERVVAWQRRYGRHDLPWQRTRSAYRIWISEVMLQQTQVSTVIPYYERFIERFPDVAALAGTPIDDVLALWSGLGYYSRARHLHATAQIVREQYGSRFPDRLDAVTALPGIGRSTAAAILVFAYGQSHAILDGNVKRVLARACGIEGYPGDARTSAELWGAAESLLPNHGVEEYTQGLMDLGVTVCVRRRPVCAACPANISCVALKERRIDELPGPRPRKARVRRQSVMLVMEHDGAILLEKRAAPGIWGGLWSFPEAASLEEGVIDWEHRYGVSIVKTETLPSIDHGFTHFDLTISPRRLRVQALTPRAGEAHRQWFALDTVAQAALPAPIRRIIEYVRAEQESRS